MSKLLFLQSLFNKGDGICFGDFKSSGIVEFNNQDDSFFNGNFVSINPLASDVDYGHAKKNYYRIDVPRRADINVTDFKTFLFEMDSIDLDDQLAILTNSQIPFTSITYSGGKSYHALLTSEVGLFGGNHTDEGIRRYKEAWQRIRLKLDATGVSMGIDFPNGQNTFIDTSCQNPSRLTRMPFSVRENGKLQEQIFSRPVLSGLEVLKVIANCPEYVKREAYVRQVESSVDSVEDFWHNCPIGLKNKLKYVDWADSEGMYPIMFRLTLWAIDSTGVSQDVFLEALWQRTFIRLLDAGYPEYKLTRGVEDAYKEKRG